MHVLDTSFKQCLFRGFKDLYLDVFFCAFNYFLYPCRMYASIKNKPFKGKACNFTPYWVKAAQRDGFRSVIYYQVDSGKRFKGPYVAAFSANYSSLHLVGRKIYNADHCVRRKFNTAALDCGCNNFLSFTICFPLCTFLQLLKPETDKVVGFRFYFSQQEISGLFACKLGNLFEI
ncbi:hypothetical protein SDC9_179410 [bioreactor metagenome]|uniref:Uncharacterized protein n=1 Tax=bioreactor metagenome TaxID=1076179 RepID=A0A645GYN9_9ZZZZ